MCFVLFTSNIHIYFSINVHACVLYTYMTAVCINVYLIMFNEYITALACFDGYAATLIIDIVLAL